MKWAGIAFLTSLLMLAAESTASAQILARRETPRSGSWEAGGGVMWSGSFRGPDSTAELTRNGETTGGFDLFTSAGRVTNGAGVGATLGYYLSRSVALEAGLRYSKPRLAYRLTGDTEDAGTVTAEETLTRYVITGSVVFHLRQWTFARRAVPFVAAGAGHIRDLHEGNELIDTGTEYHAIAGVKYWFGAAQRRFGLRGQAGVSISDGGFDFRDTSRTLAIASASVVYLF